VPLKSISAIKFKEERRGEEKKGKGGTNF